MRLSTRALARIHGLGTDIVSVSRIENSLRRFNQQFLDRIYHPQEQEAILATTTPVSEQDDTAGQSGNTCGTALGDIGDTPLCPQAERRVQFLAGRWAAKEASIKALGFRIPAHDICILPDDQGKPSMTLTSQKAITEAEKRGIDLSSVRVSIAHEDTHAVATVIAETTG